MINETTAKILRRQRYKLVGKHSAVKLCHWMRQKLFYGRPCYKETFYGIESHRCLQFTPALIHCTQRCLFCWRYQEVTITDSVQQPDDPEELLAEAIEAQRILLTGYKGDPRTDLKLWREAQNPNQIAISLAGEPTLYPLLNEFIAVCKRRGMTVFLVTNGTNPELLADLDPLPTQLYLTIAAPTETIYKKLCLPLIPNGWQKLQQTIDLLPSLSDSTRIVIRHTLVHGWNLGYVDAYAKLDIRTEAKFIEPKGYVFVGSSRQRLSLANMPTHAEIYEFGSKLAATLGYVVVTERSDSRAVLLARSDKDAGKRFLNN